MGNSQSSGKDSQLTHPAFGKWKIIKAAGSIPRDRMAISRLVGEEGDFNHWKEGLKKIDSSQARKCLFLPQQCIYQQSECCGLNGTARLVYENVYPTTLQEELEIRRSNNNPFIESELWYMLYLMVSAGLLFEQKKAKIGDVHPNNILVSSQGAVRLITTHSFPKEETNFDKVMQNPNYKAFLAPEQLNFLKKGEYPSNIDSSLSECFSIGMCMLAAGTLESIDCIYYMEDGELKIKMNMVNNLLDKMRKRYSSYLHSVVAGLLELNPFKRSKCSTIKFQLYPFEHRIMQLQDFPLQETPLSYAYFVPNCVATAQDYQPIHSKANCTNIYYYPESNTSPSNPYQTASHNQTSPLHKGSPQKGKRSIDTLISAFPE